MSAEMRPEPAARGTRSTPGARDAALALVRRINRWMIAGAIAASGGLSLWAAHIFHGRTIRATDAAASTSSGANSSGAGAAAAQPAPSVPSDPGVQAPAEAPVVAPADTAPVVSSGGS